MHYPGLQSKVFKGCGKAKKFIPHLGFESKKKYYMVLNRIHSF